MKPTEDLDDVLEDYETAAEDRDDTILNLKDELYETNEEISDEKKRLWRGNSGSGVKVSVGVLTDFQGAINIALIYGVFFFSFSCLLILIREKILQPYMVPGGKQGTMFVLTRRKRINQSP